MTNAAGPSAPALIFRETRAPDVEDTFRVRALTRQNPASPELLASWGITPATTVADLASGRMKGWVCERGGELVGFCNGDATSGEVIVLAVQDGHEGLGIGSRLLAHVVAWLRSKGFERPWLAASPDPEIRAHGFYRALGWVPTGRTLDNGDEILELPPESDTVRSSGP